MREYQQKIALLAFAIFSLASGFATTKYYKIAPSLRQTQVYSASVITGDESVNGTSDKIYIQQQPSLVRDGVISPYHVLSPDYFTSLSSPVERQLPLHSCLSLLRRTLEVIASAKYDALENEKLSVIRIEHKVSHSVDPLCWLQAQTIVSNDHPTMYFATAEGNLEASVYGSAKLYRGSAEDDEYWQLVGDLPPRTHLYGGQRFDVDSDIGKEWVEFSKGFWILPAIEVRQQKEDQNSSKVTTTVAVHLYNSQPEITSGFAKSARQVLEILEGVTDLATTTRPPTTLPPVLSRASAYGPNLDGQEVYEKGVSAALAEFEKKGGVLEKVVLARRMDLTFSKQAENNISALDILRKWKFGNKPGGHLFYINPGGNGGEFFGCTPERLFKVQFGHVLSEALAGTRPRGTSQKVDEELSRELFASVKDQKENIITGNFILTVFKEMHKKGWVENKITDDSEYGGNFFVRRLRHLQHICQRFECLLSDRALPIDAIKFLFLSLHPTPAVGGLPKHAALEFIRKHETNSFDRGFYSGPVGFVSKDSAEIVVAIRSGLVSQSDKRSKVSVFAGAGIVSGSTVQGEWAETSYKLAVVSSIFPQSPITLQSAPTPNVAWATAFVEELVRNGVTQYYICPGSRSTPLVAAISKAVRANVGSVHALSVHDERSAGFRALGYGRGSGQPAAVITSSGTAVANLYPSIIEAGMDGVPLIIITADRPYESRDTGANQAIDQVKAYSSSYIRWFRDILPPSDDVPIALALADAAHGVSVSKESRGPVHFNVQFRENLAPDSGSIRGDDRAGSVTSYDGVRFTDTPGFQRWSLGGGKWKTTFGRGDSILASSILEIGKLIMESRRGVIVVGNLRKGTTQSQTDISETVELLSTLAQFLGFPIFAGVQSGSLRFDSPAVIPFSEHLLRFPLIQDNLKPDMVLQFGTPLVSTEISKVIKKTMVDQELSHHVLIHPHHPNERADPEFTVSHTINAEIAPFIKKLISHLEHGSRPPRSSHLAPLINLGRELQGKLPSMVDLAVNETMALEENETRAMAEPEIILSLSEIISKTPEDLSLFLSNSMPVRDAEAFLYPLKSIDCVRNHGQSVMDTAMNRGASGIDGIIASAAGFADSTKRHTTLLVGDVAALHDINSLHTLRTGATMKDSPTTNQNPMTIIVVNNDGGGIFSFLPIAKHGNDVGFDDFFGTPTHTFSFEKAARAFDLPYEKAESSDSFKTSYRRSLDSSGSTIIEAVVAPRATNVGVHQGITKKVNQFLAETLGDDMLIKSSTEILPFKYSTNQIPLDGDDGSGSNSKTLVLLHGWMGDKSEWEESIVPNLLKSLPPEWSIMSIDLPGHGESQFYYSSKLQSSKDALGLNDKSTKPSFPNLSLDQMAMSVCQTLKENGITSVDALAGYSLGGRVALAMKRMCMVNGNTDSESDFKVISDDTRLILVSTFPGEISFDSEHPGRQLRQNKERLFHDEKLSNEILDVSNRLLLTNQSRHDCNFYWSDFLNRWYSAPLWGDLKKKPELYQNMINKRISSLSARGPDLAAVLHQCSPQNCRNDDWRGAQAENTLYIAGSLDHKYCEIGRKWQASFPELNYKMIPEKGHALLVEAPLEVAAAIQNFLQSDFGQEKEGRVSLSKKKLYTGPDALSLEGQRSLATKAATEEEYLHESAFLERIGSMDFEGFSIGLVDDHRRKTVVTGIGWGDSSEASGNGSMNNRSGFIIQLLSKDGSRVGLGEISPLSGVHAESLEAVEEQLDAIASKISEDELYSLPSFDATKLLALDGGMQSFIDSLVEALGVGNLLPSIRAGLEMALLSLSSQVVRLPIHQALLEYLPNEYRTQTSSSLLSLNGLITRGTALQVSFDESERIFESWKVKVGHQNPEDDAMAVATAFQLAPTTTSGSNSKIRADANRGFNISGALEFASRLSGMGIDDIEYIEEPLEKEISGTVSSNQWTLEHQVDHMEAWYNQTLIPFALDETMLDLAEMFNYEFDSMLEELKKVFKTTRGCTAFVLKPSLLGLELSLRLARAAKRDLGIGAVFTSTFDTGIGLSYASFLGSLSDVSAAKGDVNAYSHGLGTFSMLSDDCLDPPFGSYVNKNGQVNVASLSRAFYGLSLNEIQSLSTLSLPSVTLQTSEMYMTDSPKDDTIFNTMVSDQFEASTTISKDGREVTVVASLPLPFSAEIACARFTDLPQQPRWSPWISSVAYLEDGETEWTLQVRGIRFRWKATSSLLDYPNKGITWGSVSGLKNKGIVEFVPTGDSCLMKVTIAFVTPRILSKLFRGTVFEDFLRNNILKWSLEMFRDVVKGDLALEDGNIELGDALFGSVEGKASAIEATLSSPLDK